MAMAVKKVIIENKCKKIDGRSIASEDLPERRSGMLLAFPCSIRSRSILASATLLLSGTAAPGQSIPGDWKLTFSDEFDGKTLDATKWTVGYHFNAVINNERQHYVPENVILDGTGILKFKAEKRKVTAAPPNMKFAKEYASGQIETWGKFTQTYGLFEARIKMPKAKGLWPAFWMMPDRGESVPGEKRMSTFEGGMEIDTMEYLTSWGDYTHTGMVWDGYGTKSRSHGAGGKGEFRHYVRGISDSFHTYTAYWEEGRILFFVDGVLIDGLRSDRIPTVPMHLILNCAIGGRWPESEGKIHDQELSDIMEIDWVRVYSGTISKDLRIPDLENTPCTVGGVPHPIPGKIEAEQFNHGKRGVAWWDKDDWSQGSIRKRPKGADVVPTHIAHGESGEWHKYTVSVPRAGLYTVTVRAKSPAPATFKICLDDQANEIAKISHPFGSNWSTASVSSVSLPAGEHQLKVVMDGKEIEFDWIQFDEVSRISANQ